MRDKRGIFCIKNTRRKENIYIYLCFKKMNIFVFKKKSEEDKGQDNINEAYRLFSVPCAPLVND